MSSVKFLFYERTKNMSRIRLNQEFRNKIGTRMRVHLEQEDTQEKQTYDNLKADQIEINDNAWVKNYDYRSYRGEEDIYYFVNKITKERRPLTEEQYNDNNYTITERIT